MNDRLFQTLKIGEMRLPNRLIMPTIKLGYGTKGGEVTKRHISFYVRRVQGGVGLIVTEPMYISPNGKEIPTQLGIHDDGLKKGLQELVGAVHKEGGRIMAHINHAGRAINPNLVPEGERVSASDVPCPANGVTPVLCPRRRSGLMSNSSLRPHVGLKRSDLTLLRYLLAMATLSISSSPPTATIEKMNMGEASRIGCASAEKLLLQCASKWGRDFL